MKIQVQVLTQLNKWNLYQQLTIRFKMLLKQKLVAFVQQHLDQVYLKIQHTLKILDRELTSNLLNFKEIQSQPMLKGHYTIQRLMVN